jgi:hypothetical protein
MCYTCKFSRVCTNGIQLPLCSAVLVGGRQHHFDTAAGSLLGAAAATQAKGQSAAKWRGLSEQTAADIGREARRPTNLGNTEQGMGVHMQ